MLKKGNKMEVIEELLYQKAVQGWDWFLSVWWYWLFAGMGLFFRVGIQYREFDTETRLKKILRDIVIAFALSVSWSGMNTAGLDDNVVVMLLILTFVYTFYGLAENCKATGGTTESLLLIIKSTLVTMLAFQTIWGTLFGAILTCVLAILAYKYWFVIEKKSDLFEIIFLCVEAFLLSIYGEFNSIQGIGVFLFVFYEETAFFLLNYLVKEGAKRFFGEAE